MVVIAIGHGQEPLLGVSRDASGNCAPPRTVAGTGSSEVEERSRIDRGGDEVGSKKLRFAAIFRGRSPRSGRVNTEEGIEEGEGERMMFRKSRQIPRVLFIYFTIESGRNVGFTPLRLDVDVAF